MEISWRCYGCIIGISRGYNGNIKRIYMIYDVCLSCHSDVEDLQVPISLKKLVEPFVITFYGDYIVDMNEK